MPDEKQLVPKLKEWLRQQGVTATVAVSRKGCIEIRLEAQDLMAQTFAVARPVVVHTHGDVSPMAVARKKKQKPVPEKKGFGLSLLKAQDGLPEPEIARIKALMQKYEFISVSRESSKTWDETCTQIMWLSSGFFVDNHKWDPQWLSQATQKGGGPALLANRFSSVDDVLGLLEKCLDYISESHRNGAYWYPPLENGKVAKRSLLSFIVSPMKSGLEWSPLCGVLLDMEKSTAIKRTLPRRVVAIAQETLEDSYYLRSLPDSNLSRYWQGVKCFMEWYNRNRDKLMSVTNNRVHLSDIGSAMALVRDWNHEMGGGAIPITYLYPGIDRWSRFVGWCGRNRNVILPGV